MNDLKLDGATVLLGDCIERLKELPDRSVQMCVTSPPYFGLRDYGVGGQIGLEETPDAYIAKMVEVFREVRRVLADDGTTWLNIGDSYASTGGHSSIGSTSQRTGRSNVDVQNARKGYAGGDGIKTKDLIGIPWMLAFALRADGWYLRQDIIWHKPNPMPESVRDRCTKAHEYIFLLSKSDRYFYDAEAVKEPAVSDHASGNGFDGRQGGAEYMPMSGGTGTREQWMPGGKRNRRSVWTINTRPYKGAHFAVFPPSLVEPCILAGTSERGHCPGCGARHARVTERETSFEGGSGKAGRTADEVNASGKHIGGVHGGNKNLKLGPVVSTNTTGWRATCDCGLDPVPDAVLDPFNGSGTTGQVAIEHDREYVGVELNPEYLDLTRRRLESALVKREADRDLAAPAPQMDLFGETA